MTIKLLRLENEIKWVESNDKDLLKKTLTGRFPFMSDAKGMQVYDHLPIARVLAKEHPALLGTNEKDQHLANMWMDMVNGQVVPNAKRVIAQCNGLNKPSMDLRAFSMAQSDLRQALQGFESHLRLRNFLVGHSLTLADVFLVGILTEAFSMAVDKKSRDANFPNLQRYVSLILQMPCFASVFGPAQFCKDASFVPVQPAQK